MLLLSLTLALASAAAPEQQYPLLAEIRAPAEGVSRIEVPSELLVRVTNLETLNLLLVDRSGDPVPFAIVASATPMPVAVHVEPIRPADDGTGPLSWTITPVQRPIDALTVSLPQQPAAATVRVYDAGGEPVAAPTRIWHIPSSTSDQVRLERAVTGPLRVEVDTDSQRRTQEPVFGGSIGSGPLPATRELPVTSRSWEEGGLRRYDIDLGVPLAVSGVVLDPTEEVFQRDASARQGWARDAPGAYEYTYTDQAIARQRLGGGNIDLTHLNVTGEGDRLSVLVRGTPELTFDTVTVEVPGLWLLVSDPGAGPFTLFGGAEGAGAPSDLQYAANELLTLVSATADVDPVAPNPAFVAPEDASGVASPGRRAELERQQWEREVTGPEALVRLPLDAHVLRNARSDLGDLRLVDSRDREIPFLLRRRVARDSEPATFTRSEDHTRSRLVLDLGDESAPLESITLFTDATVFSRTVTLYRESGNYLRPLRTVQWDDLQGAALSLRVDDAVGGRVVVEIENQADAPLTVTGVEVTWPAWEILARLPAGGGRLVYGDIRSLPPEYDLDRLSGRLWVRDTAAASLGDPVAIRPTPPRWIDRALAAAGIGGLALGLLALLISLLRSTPPAPVAAAAAGPSAAPEPDAPAPEPDPQATPRSSTPREAPPSADTPADAPADDDRDPTEIAPIKPPPDRLAGLDDVTAILTHEPPTTEG